VLHFSTRVLVSEIDWMPGDMLFLVITSGRSSNEQRNL
jgi:hypothetical protein